MSNQHEGPKMGRPRFDPEYKQRKRNITMADDVAEMARQIGEGNISRGIRIAVEKMYQSWV